LESDVYENRMTDPARSETRSSDPDMRVGLDTGGTFTDAVALDGERRVLASAKALTTHWDLSVGLGEALRAVLSGFLRRHARNIWWCRCRRPRTNAV
jgi:hypothetical protein